MSSSAELPNIPDRVDTVRTVGLTVWEVADALWLAPFLGGTADTPVSDTTLRPPKRQAPEQNPTEEVAPPVTASRDTPASLSEEKPLPEGNPSAKEEPLPRKPPSPTAPRAVPALSVLSPDQPFPDTRPFIHALRSLKRTVPDCRPESAELDEEATAEQGSVTGLWFPVTRQGTSPWLDLTVVIDSGASMALWRPTVQAFVDLLRQSGAFRKIAKRLLDTDTKIGPPNLHGGAPGSPARDPGELVDPSGRRLLLVLTDGVGAAWGRGQVAPLLARWGATQPVAVVNLLPERRWRELVPATYDASVRAPAPLRPNSDYDLAFPNAWFDPVPAELAGAVPVPMLGLTPDWIRWWSRLVTGKHPSFVPATVLFAGETVLETLPEEADHDSPADQVHRFLGSASPTASALAKLLAAVPVNLAMARVVQAELLPEAAPTDIPEIFTSGLLRKQTDDLPWDRAGFEFNEDIRALLLSRARRSDTARAVHVAARQFGRHSPALAQMSTMLAMPEKMKSPDALAATVLTALGGVYDRRRQAEAERSTVEKGSNNMTKAPEWVEEPGETSSLPHSAAEEQDDSPAVGANTGHAVDLLPQPNREREGRTSADTPAVWGPVPPPNPNFTGRSDLLTQLEEQLPTGTTAVLPSALHGMGGIGKTQIALEYVYRHRQDYDIVWWIQANGETQIRSAYLDLARSLRLRGTEDATTAIREVREALRVGTSYGRWLLVFDSAEDPEMVRPYFPVDGVGDILVTSRNPDWGDIANPLEIKVFEREESKELLRRRGRVTDNEEAEQLAIKLGDLPLAIAQAAAWRAETGMPVAEYLRLFEEKVAEILDTEAPTDYEVSVAAAWNVSFDELGKHNPGAHQLLQVCAFFSPDPISRALFNGIRGVKISPELDDVLRDPLRLARAIRDINRYGLAKIDHRNETIVLHRLVQLVLRNRMRPETAEKMRHGAHLLLANYDPNDPASSEQWSRYIAVMPHVYAAEVIDCDDRWVRQLVINLVNFLHHWGNHQEALTLAETAMRAWSATLGPDDPQTLQVAERYGFYLWTMGRYAEAREINSRTLQLYRDTLGDNSEETLNAQRTVAADLKGSGDFAAAVELNRETYEKADALFGEDDPATLRSAQDYAVSLYLIGAYEQARELAETTHARRAEILGYDNTSTINTLSLLIISRREGGDYHWARIEQEKLYDRVSRMFGEGTDTVLRSMFNLAVARRKDGNHDEATELSREALDGYRRRYDETHPSAMAAALAYSIDLRHSRDLAAAHRLGEQTFNLYRETMGENHIHTLSAALDLGVTLRLSGDVAAARQLDERSLTKMREQFGPEYPLAIVCAIGVASDLFALGEIDAALALDEETWERAKRTLGENHPTTLGVQNNLALDLRAVQRTDEADAMHADAVTRYQAVLGEEHPGTVAAAAGSRAECDIDPMPL